MPTKRRRRARHATPVVVLPAVRFFLRTGEWPDKRRTRKLVKVFSCATFGGTTGPTGTRSAEN